MLRNRNKVLGMNARSAIYLRYNKKEPRERADQKLTTKQLLNAAGISTAELLAVLRTPSEVEQFDWESLPPSFVIKPNRGLGGEGIQIIFNRLKNGNWLTTHGRQLTKQDFVEHVLNILDGNFSLLHTPDIAIIETRLSVDPLYKRFSSEGIPDIRVIVYNQVPVMGMIRVPTKKSHGKANLAQGGLGIGIDITTGFTTYVIQKSSLFEREIDKHPDTGVQLRGIKLPYWDRILEIAVLSARVIGLSYCGVDVSIDKKRGPVILELNARPGLGIQVANMAPLRERLQRIQGLKVESPERGIAIAKELFGGQLEEEVQNITGRQVIGLIEPITIFGKGDIRKKVLAKIDTGAKNSSIDTQLARDLGFGEAIDLFKSQEIPQGMKFEEAEKFAVKLEKKLTKENEDIARVTVVQSSHGMSVRMHVRITLLLAGDKMTIEPNVFDRAHMTYPVLVGKLNLSHYLVDVAKVTPIPKGHK